MKRPRTLSLTLLLSFLSTLGPFSLDMYLPSLPDIGLDLHASTLQVQLTISSYLFGSAVGQIFYGPVSDRLGRRPVLLWALVFYAIITTSCAVAPSVGALITLRFVQGVGVAGIMALARATVRDISSGVRAGRDDAIKRRHLLENLRFQANGIFVKTVEGGGNRFRARLILLLSR